MQEQYQFRVHIERVENDLFLATSEDVPGLVAQGRTIPEALEIAGDVARKIVESYRDRGDELPISLHRIERECDLDVAVTI